MQTGGHERGKADERRTVCMLKEMKRREKRMMKKNLEKKDGGQDVREQERLG